MLLTTKSASAQCVEKFTWVPVGAYQLQLDATGSTVPGGTIVSYHWRIYEKLSEAPPLAGPDIYNGNTSGPKLLYQFPAIVGKKWEVCMRLEYSGGTIPMQCLDQWKDPGMCLSVVPTP